jgi:chemotaxis protein CheZ
MMNPSSSAALEPAGESQPALDSVAVPDRLHKPDGTLDAEAVYARLGELTRTLHNAMRALGYDRDIEQAAVSMLPEARSRLSYIARLTGEAAEKVLNAVDSARGEQDALAQSARQFEAAVRQDPAAALAGGAVLEFIAGARGQAERTNAHLTDIMMAQDFHDLTGQVTRKLVGMVQELEADLLKLLLEATLPAQRPQVDAGWLAGPVFEDTERSDVVSDQQQVDDLLDSLGF